MLEERNIPEEWVWETVENPDKTRVVEKNSQHYFKSISKHGDRILHVVVNPLETPMKIITVFFDRRERKKK
jgi:hypothetical protein